MKVTCIRFAATVLVVVFLVSASVFAQQLATVRVTVADTTGAIVPGANITVKSTQTGLTRTAKTEANGVAVIPDLPPGSYELTATSDGFRPAQIPLRLSVGQIASFTVPLGVKVRQENIEVRESADTIDAERSDVSQIIESSNITELPIAGRDFIDFVLLTPSVNVGRSTAVGAQSPFTETVLKLSFAGVRESHSSFFALDGVDYTTSISGVQRISPSQDWVEEFRVVDSPYSSDVGRNLGSVVNTITKSGTNVVHGSAYDYFRNNALDAKNLLSAPGFNTLRMNQFGGTLSGPIKKEKLFFFTGYEGQRRAESPIYSGFILHNINPNPAACPVLPPVGVFNPACKSINATKHFFGLQPENLASILMLDNYDKFIAKSNAVISQRTTLNVTYLFNDTRKDNVRGAAPGEGLPSSYRNNPVRDQTVYGDLIHVFSPSTTSDTLLQFGRRTFNLDPVGAGLEPAINIPNLLSGGGFVGSVSFYREQRFEASENVTMTRGNHTLKFGGEIQPIWTAAQVPLFSPAFGIFIPDSFLGNAPFDGSIPVFSGPTPVVFLFNEPRQFFGQQIPNRDPNFQNGLFAGPSQAAFNNGTSLSYPHTLWATYVQDQWRVRPNLSLTAGVRYDVDLFPSAADVKIQGKFHPTNWGNVQPRVAFAYSFNGGKSVARGGFGLFTAPFVYSDIMVSWIGASEFTYMNQPLLPEFQNPSENLIGFGASGAVGIPGPGGAGPAFANFVTTGAYPSPSSVIQFPLGYAKRKFPNPLSEEASFELEHQFGDNWIISAGYQWMHAQRLPVYSSINAVPNGTLPWGKQAFAPADPNFGFVLYVHPIGFSLYNAGTFSLRKSFAQHYSILTNYTWSKSIDISTTINLPNTPENYLHPEFDRAVGDNDVRHRLTVALVGETPKRWPLLARDFTLSILSSLQSARAFSIIAPGDINGDGFPFSDRVGNSPRNSYKGDPYYDVDLRLQRAIPFSERVKAQLSAEAFNILNRVNVQDVNNVYAAPNFVGPVPQHFGDGITDPSGSFGTPKFASPAREVQLSFRVTF